jgi:hypothetical protein
MKKLTDRSRILTYEDCPRKRWWRYEYQGKGIVPRESPLALAVGASVHKGLEGLLRDEGLSGAVEAATTLFSEIARRGVSYPQGSQLYQAYQEQRYLVEAMLYAYAAYALPRLLETYEVLEVEREEVFGDFSPSVALMARADGLLRERATGDLHVLSFKTCGEYGKRQEEEGRYDIQGLSEMLATGERLGRLPEAVKMEYLVKGKLLDGQQRSPLVHPWARLGIRQMEFAWSWDFTDADGKARKLGRDYQRVNMWELMPAKDWVAMLDSGYVQPEAGPTLPRQFASPAPYYRSEKDIREWKAQAAAQEMRIAGSVEHMRKNPLMGGEREYLPSYFPKHRRACLWPTPCPYIPLCHKGLSPEDALTGGEFQWREPHHEAEKERQDANQ